MIFCTNKGLAQVKDFSFYYNRPIGDDFKEIEKFSIKVDKYYSLYIKNILVFEGAEDSIVRYEILDNKYVLISFF